MRIVLSGFVVCLALSSVSTLQSADETASKYWGWRGNGTGLFPDANVPAEWSIISTGPAEGLMCAAVPADASGKDAFPVVGGLVTKWLVIGPFAVKDGNADFAKELIPDETTIAPAAGDKVGDLEWKPAEPASPDGVSFKNINAGGGKGKTNEGALATTCLFAAKAGKLRAVIEHPVQAKAFVNGREVYSNTNSGVVMGSAYGLSRNRLAAIWPVGPAFEFDVKAGWNRLTVKLMSTPRAGWNDLMFMLRVEDTPPVSYERKNIAWETPLPDRSNATPIIVGDRIFLASEPDELISIDRNTGKVLWNAMNGYYDATPAAEREANPAFKEKIDPLAKAYKDEKDPVARWAARKKLQDALVALDKAKYTIKPSGHLAGHFDIVGFSTTPASDGKSVFAWTGAGVAACYDLDGNRKWIRRLPAGDELHYSASPAVTAGKLAVFFEQLYGLDAATGEIAWQQPEVNKTCASLLAARIAGIDVFISQQGEVVRASDGKMLWKNPHKIKNDTGWAAPVVSGDSVYIPWFGIAQVFVEDFAGCDGDEWKPKESLLADITRGVPRAKGDQGDPWTAGSPLILDGMLYDTDIHSRYYVVDLATRKRLAWKDLELPGESNYVALRMAASPALIGKFIIVMDNQGNSVTLEPGAECKVISRNRLGAEILRDWAMSTQEFTGYSPPVAAGNRMYIRGERHLYCIGQK